MHATDHRHHRLAPISGNAATKHHQRTCLYACLQVFFLFYSNFNFFFVYRLQTLIQNINFFISVLRSVTSKQSLEELIPIYREIHEVKQSDEHLPMILVGNKCDEDNQREVTPEYAAEMVSKILKGCGSIETSAKTGHNVPEAFQVRKLFFKKTSKFIKCKLFLLNATLLNAYQNQFFHFISFGFL